MWSWFIHRVHAAELTTVVADIARNAEVIRRPGSGHGYGHSVEYVCRFEGGRRVVVLDRQPRPEAFWCALTSEADVLRLVHERRGNGLFGPRSITPPPNPLAVLRAELRERYEAVNDRESERALLREAEQRLPPVVLAEETILGMPSELYWRHLRARWKYTKRHTTATSFPFLRAGIDVYKADGFELGDPSRGKPFYAFVLFHY